MDFTNPVLNADWPDPDVVRVGDDYYLVVSSFNRAPGLPVLHSRDLVTWEVVARALPALPPEEHYRLPRHGAGVWAPSLRHHDGTFHITYPDPDHGIFVLSAEDPRGPWSPPRLLLGGTGLIDPCPLWDDGRAYLVHGWARSRSGIANRLTMVEADPGLTMITGTPRTVVDGDELPGYHTLEGPKLYKRDGWYWIFAPAGGVETGWQSVFRARDIFGPYEGRVVHLQPMTWDTGGWPVIGAAGEPVLTHRRPNTPASPQREPARADGFTGTSLGLQWHWQANPSPGWLTLPGAGTLRLRVLPDDAGERSVDRRQEHTLARGAGMRAVEVRAHCDAEGMIDFAWRLPGAAAWRDVETRFAATAGKWIGADIGLLAASPLGAPVVEDHVTFGPVSVDLPGVEEVAA